MPLTPAAHRDPQQVGARLRARRRRAAALAQGRRRWRSAARCRVDDAFGTILRACLQHWCVNEAAALDGRDPEGVHQMRVGAAPPALGDRRCSAG